MEAYQRATMEITEFEVEDVITTSGGYNDGNITIGGGGGIIIEEEEW